MGKVIYTRELPSTMEAVGDTLKDALEALRRHDWIAPDQEFYARLCLEEALVNAVTHGNCSDACRTIHLDMREDDTGEYCVIRVRDEGCGFTPDEIQLPEINQPNGRGICLIRYCMSEVKFDEKDHCLIMKMRRKGLCQGDKVHG
ncbi:MAG: hypothetical protein AMXMBFR84_40710 [Candidatus Hydrogenedentota bacterium]